jgi:hypothetical protein
MIIHNFLCKPSPKAFFVGDSFGSSNNRMEKVIAVMGEIDFGSF